MRAVHLIILLLALPLTAPHASAASALAATDPAGDDVLLFPVHDYPIQDPTGHVEATVRVDYGCHASAADLVAARVAVENGNLVGSLEVLDASDPWMFCEGTVAFPVHSLMQRIRLEETAPGNDRPSKVQFAFETGRQGQEACAHISDPARDQALEVCEIGEQDGNRITWQIPLDGVGADADGTLHAYSLTGVEMAVTSAWAVAFAGAFGSTHDSAHVPGTLTL